MSQVSGFGPHNFPAGFVQTLTGNDGIHVPPTAGNINVVGDGTYITTSGDIPTSTLTINLINGGSYATSFHGDTAGIAVPSAGVIDIQSQTQYAGTVQFANTSNLIALSFTDFHSNTIIGTSSYAASANTASANVGLGFNVLNVLTTGGTFNTSIGTQSALYLTTGAYNSILGGDGGLNLATGSSNIYLGYLTAGGGDESNTLRIGVGSGTGFGQLSTAYVAGIYGVSPSSPQMVIINSSNQLGSQAIPSGITTINGDTGSITGTTVSIKGSSTAGASIVFSGSGTAMTLNVTDSNENLYFGSGSGVAVTTGIAKNIGIGYQTLKALVSPSSANHAIGFQSCEKVTSGKNNIGIGQSTLYQITTGSHNICLGYEAGGNYSSSESNNIIIGDTNTGSGTVGESNVLRIGPAGTGSSTGQLNKAFISGINGITVSTADQVLLINSSNQLGAIAAGSSGTVLTSAGAGANPAWSALPTTIASINVQTFTTSGTYTPTSGMVYCIIEVLGGGGGGGGSDASTGNQTSGGGGGGAGGYARLNCSAATIGASQTVTVGAGGAGGAAGNNTGNTGDTTSVGSLVSATGGAGGAGSAASIIGNSPGGLGGTGSNGDINANGASGGASFLIDLAGTFWGGFSGKGADSIYGGGGLSEVQNQGTGASATLYGAGGGGGVTAPGTQPASAGGDGSAGIVIITEYVS